ncbi:MAG: hypothetical protein K0M78_03510 [Brevundimonas sp.]|nr:hypothetical protein [Brevundimonas sp.]
MSSLVEWGGASRSAAATDVSADVLNWGVGTASASAPRPSSVEQFVAAPQPEERIFDRLVAFKVNTSQLAMHLQEAWRSGLFKQLDYLLDADDWDYEDRLPTVESFKTFLRMIIALGEVRRPSLGSTSAGDIIAAWTQGQDRLTVECLSDDQVRWVVRRNLRGESVTVAGKNSSSLLLEVLAPYNIGEMLGG